MICIRKYPPGVVLEHEGEDGLAEQKVIDFLNLTKETDVDEMVKEVMNELDEGLIQEDDLRNAISELVQMKKDEKIHKFEEYKSLKSHTLPISNCFISKTGDKIITGGYDRTCKVWDTITGEELHTLEGHTKVVYALDFGGKDGDIIATGSFDKTAKLWNSNTGELLHSLEGHTAEIVCLEFNPDRNLLATGAMDNNVKIWDVESGHEVCSFNEHSAEVVSVNFSTDGDKLLTGSFDNTAKIWDVKNQEIIHTLSGHTQEITSAKFDYSEQY